MFVFIVLGTLHLHRMQIYLTFMAKLIRQMDISAKSENPYLLIWTLISWITDFTWIYFWIIHNIRNVCVLPYFPLNLVTELVSHIHRLTSLPSYKVVLRHDSVSLLEKLTTSVCALQRANILRIKKKNFWLVRKLTVSAAPLAPCYKENLPWGELLETIITFIGFHYNCLFSRSW